MNNCYNIYTLFLILSSQLKDLENERMAELGTSISKTQKEAEPERRHRIASRAGDLMSSARLNARDSVRSKRLSKGDFGEPASCGWSVWREHSTLHHYMYMLWVISSI